ncbi:MAG: tetratricopeptide repeat protein [Melioribacteraceae bacterium]|nr:tetratricopeptide repeat protein [Melioribacteraceae bacterium]MCF8353828.1 tetratricopeptide repeat protein [Melioribacteraceae bacterium]MCF8393664.1 tetratricopeptide repeat protein [Melioribacteraceae bacterium]MCF8419474.1 tetratricopeptide repeat protein [Melioribacteraceae bacterium]
MKLLFTYSFLLIFGISMSAQNYEFDLLIKKGIKQIYSLEFEKAQQTFNQVQDEYPQHPAGKFFDAMIVWWKIMLDMNNEKYDDMFYDKLENTIDFCDEILDENPGNADAVFFKGGALGFRGRLLSIRNDWFSAALDGKDALPLVFKANELDSQNTDVQLGFGIYNYYAAVIPEKYPVVKPFMFMFPSGDKEKGINQLKKVAEEGKYANYESQYFLMTLFYSFEKNNNEAMKYAEQLHKAFPENPVFHRYLGRIYVRKGDYNSAAEHFKRIFKKSLKAHRGYDGNVKREAVYYIGMNHKMRNRPDSAMIYFEECANISKLIDEDESGFWVNSVLYQAEIKEQVKKYDEAIAYYEKVLDMEEYKDSHTKAENRLKRLRKIKM